MHVGPRRHELRRELECLRRRIRVLEAPRVGDETDVERERDLGRKRDVEPAQHVAHDLGRRRRVRHDQVHLAEARVVVVVVDVDHHRGPLYGRAVLADPPLVRAIDGEKHALAHVVGNVAPKLVE